MPFRLILTIILMVLAAIFTGFNLENKCDVWLVHNFESVPVALTIIVSFLAGMLIMLPFTFGKKRGKDKDKAKEEKLKKKALKNTPAAQDKKESENKEEILKEDKINAEDTKNTEPLQNI